MLSYFSSLRKRYRHQLGWFLAIALACLVSLTTHSARVGMSIPCKPPPIDVVQSFLREQRGFLQVKSILTSRSKKLNGAAVRLFYYNQEFTRRILVTEDINPESPESLELRGELPLNVDEFFKYQLDRHDSGDGFFYLAADLRDGIVKTRAIEKGISYFASAPIIDPEDRRLKGYISLTLTDPTLPTTRESILDQLSISASDISYILFPARD